jgi:hypothetical protein
MAGFRMLAGWTDQIAIATQKAVRPQAFGAAHPRGCAIGGRKRHARDTTVGRVVEDRLLLLAIAKVMTARYPRERLVLDTERVYLVPNKLGDGWGFDSDGGGPSGETGRAQPFGRSSLGIQRCLSSDDADQRQPRLSIPCGFARRSKLGLLASPAERTLSAANAAFFALASRLSLQFRNGDARSRSRRHTAVVGLDATPATAEGNPGYFWRADRWQSAQPARHVPDQSAKYPSCLGA